MARVLFGESASQARRRERGRAGSEASFRNEVVRGAEIGGLPVESQR